jgi:hypothetical protein
VDPLNPPGLAAYRYSQSGPLEWAANRLQFIALERSGPLSVFRLQISSPGVAEAVGELNPLKHIERGVSNWRHENTERERIRTDVEVRQRELDQQERRDREQEELTRRQQNMEFILSLLDRIHEAPHEMQSVLLDQLNRAQESVSEISRHRGVESVTVRELPATSNTSS